MKHALLGALAGSLLTLAVLGITAWLAGRDYLEQEHQNRA